jgi:hypothetical protein
LGSDLDPNRLAEQLLEWREMPVRRPHFELRVPRRVQFEEEVLAAIAQIESGNHLGVAAFEALGEAEDGRQQPHRAAQA